MATPFVPTSITVHLGAPNEPAENVRVPYIDYIKNVVSSEIYPTWPRSSLLANIFTIQSFTLNRVYTEYYRTRGYEFDITSSTLFDQAFIPGRKYFEPISDLVDNYFNTYIVRGNQIQPLAAQYCSGSGVTCSGLSQWGTVSLANQGFSPIEILRYYFGQDVSLVFNAPTAANIPSYTGTPYQLGSAGSAVRTIQRELNRVSANYPAIPRIGSVNGIYDAATRRAVIAFQQIFGLEVDGIVGKQTWYKLKYIYNGVKNLSEIYSEGLTISEVERVFSTTLREGSRGIAVRTIQYYLNFIGQFNDILTINLDEDGIFGPATRRAVEAFQRYYGLSVDGIVGRATWNTVLDVYRGILQSLPAEYTGLTYLLYPGYYIMRGASGKIVEQLQVFLRTIAANDNSVPPVAVDGVFGAQTQAAVVAVQNHFDLEPDGVVGPITWNAIISLYNEYR